MLSAYLNPRSAAYRATRQIEAMPRQEKKREEPNWAMMMAPLTADTPEAKAAAVLGLPQPGLGAVSAPTGDTSGESTYTAPTSTVAGALPGTDGMSDDFITALNAMYGAMPEDIRSGLSINSGFRSPEHQARIISNHFGKYGFSDSDLAAWNADVASMGPIQAGQKWASRFGNAGMRKWIALPGSSQHQRGFAADLGFGNPAVKDWIHSNAGQYGLHFPMSYEPWHIELVGARG